MEGPLKDILVLFMLIMVYFLPYFLIFKLIKLSAGALGKIQGAIDGFANKSRNSKGLREMQEKAQKSAQGWAGSQYKAGAANRRDKARNAFSRLATGNIGAGTKGSRLRAQMRTAGLGSEYSKQRNEEADFLVENTYASKGFAEGGDWLVEQAKMPGKIGEASLRLIAETKRFDLLDKVVSRLDENGKPIRDSIGNIVINEDAKGKTVVSRYADENRSFGAAVAGARKDLLDPTKTKIQMLTAPEILAQHDSIFGSVKKDEHGNTVYTAGTFTASLDPKTIAQLRSDKDIYNRLGAAGKAFIDSKGGLINPPVATNPSSPPPPQAAP